MQTVASPARAGATRRSKRLLALAGDERLVAQLRSGNEAAFEVVYERYGKGILGFCRHMLGSQEEAEDAVQQVFASAYRDLVRPDGPELRLKPWLYTIARNRCLSMLRARREEVHVDWEPASAGLAEQVERRAELQELLGDLRDLPAEQRAALLLAELADLSHTEIGQVLDCEAARVKALVYRARSSLIERREARETPCEEIREQLSVLTGGSLRRSEIRHHLRSCSGCRAYREQVKQQRKLLAAALPVVPPAWLKASVLGGSGAGAGAGAAGAGAGAAGSALATKAAVLAVLAGGGAVATQAEIEHHHSARPASPPHVAAHHSASSATSRAAPTAPRSSGGARHHIGRGTATAAPGERKQPTRAATGSASDRGANPPAATPGHGAKKHASNGNGASHGHANGHGREPVSTPPSGPPAKPKPAKKEPPVHPDHPPHPATPAKPPQSLNGNGAAGD